MEYNLANLCELGKLQKKNWPNLLGFKIDLSRMTSSQAVFLQINHNFIEWNRCNQISKNISPSHT